MKSPFLLDCRGRMLDCRPERTEGPHVMGILNVTPDSFFDGGRYEEVDVALSHATQMLEEGASIIDVGGASSRPRGKTYGEGAQPLSPGEEQDRVLPVIESLVRHAPEALISIDTYHPQVARAALEAGAHVVNDITGLRLYPETATVAATYGAPLILMHALGAPGTMPHEHTYTDVVQDVLTSLQEALETATRAGVQDLVVDPGFGFGKSPTENLRLINHVDTLLTLGRPVLVGLSRKSTIGAILGSSDAPHPVEERLFGTLGATAVAVLRGATLIRTHDVQPTVEMLRVLSKTTRE